MALLFLENLLSLNHQAYSLNGRLSAQYYLFIAHLARIHNYGVYSFSLR